MTPAAPLRVTRITTADCDKQLDRQAAAHVAERAVISRERDRAWRMAFALLVFAGGLAGVRIWFPNV